MKKLDEILKICKDTVLSRTLGKDYNNYIYNILYSRDCNNDL